MIEIRKILLALFCLVLHVNANNAEALFDTTPPTVEPGTGETPAPSSAYNATSVAPTTSAPSSAATTAAPTTAPSSHATSSAPSLLQTTTSVPSAHATTAAPSNATSFAPSSHTTTATAAPSTSPPNPPSSASPLTLAPSKHYTPPSVSPSSSIAPSPTSHHRRGGAAKIIGKTIGWLILIALSTLAFGAIMSNRYRIYYVVRGIWYSFLSLDCTRRLMTLLRMDGGGPAASASLNEIIFDQNDLAEGLLMGDQ